MVVGEIIGAAVAKELVTRLTNLAIDEVALQWGFEDDVLSMIEKMGDLERVMDDAHNKVSHGGPQEEDAALERWHKKLGSAANDLAVVLDEFDAMKRIKNRKSKMEIFFSGNNQFYQRLLVPHKMQSLRKRIEKIEKDGWKLNLVSKPRASNESFAGMEITILGRKIQQDNIINLLLRSEANEHISIIPIVGLGGIGKTALAQSVYMDTRVNVFDKKVWVHVPKDFSLIKIGSSILRSLDGNINLHQCDLQFISESLRKELATRRYLIFLDDLWEEDWTMLNSLKDMLPYNRKGSRLIVTTSNQNVVEALRSSNPGNKFCPVPQTEQINLSVLSDDDCWTIMKQRAFNTGDDRNALMEKIGREIVERKCGGLPLVAISLGYVMSKRSTPAAWRKIRDTHIEETTLKRLMLSYNFMNWKYRQCFKYLASFPRGFIISSDHLIQQWIALSYINTKDDGEVCINYLLGMSFLYISRPSPVTPSQAQAQRRELTMHDLVHELAANIMGNEFLVLDARLPSNTSRSKRRSCRHAQLISCHNQSDVFQYLPRKVTSLHFRDNSAELPLPHNAFSRSKNIRVLDLDLSGCQSTPNNIELSSSLHKLKVLRYLDATGLPFASLHESFFILQNMQTLILSNCLLEILPENISSLHKLCYLDLSCSSRLHRLPTSIEEIHGLSFLNLSSCSSLEQLPESICNLICLSHLDMSKCCALKNIPDNFGSLENLSFLDLSGCPELTNLPENFGSLQNLLHLDMSGCCDIRKLPDSFVRLSNLLHLNMSNCYAIQLLPDNFGSLSSLLFLNLSGCSKLTKLPDNIRIESLKHMNLSNCHKLENLPHDFGSLKMLEFLNLSDCYKISSLPNSFCQLIHLKDLDLSDCHDLSELPSCFGNLEELVFLNLTSCCKMQLLPESFCKLLSLRRLNLSYCMNLKELPSSFGVLALQFLDISSAMSLEDLPDSLGSMTSLIQLEITSGNPEMFGKAREIKRRHNFRGQIEHDGSSSILGLAELNCCELRVMKLQSERHLEEADRMKLCDKSELRLLCLEWTLQGEGDKSLLEKLLPPPTLVNFFLYGYMSKDFPEWMCDISSYLPSLTYLNLSHSGICDPVPPFGRLPNLRGLCMKDCPNITEIGKGFYGEGRTCTKLRLVILESMKNLTGWWTTRSGEESEEFLIPNLHRVELIDCPKLKFLPYPPRSIVWVLKNNNMVLPKRGFGKLSSSTLPSSMTIIGCEFSSDKWDRLQYLPTLETFIVKSCSGMKELPKAINWITSLRILYLWSLHDLKVIPEWLGQLTSIEAISVIDCPRVKTLPESMKQLTSLRKLWLEKCNGLHILEEWLGQILSAQEIYIIHCEHVTSLPKTIGNLKALKKLYIHGCADLVQWCQGKNSNLISRIPEVTLDGCNGESGSNSEEGREQEELESACENEIVPV